MSPFLDPNDPHYSDTPDVSLHPLEGEKNVRPAPHPVTAEEIVQVVRHYGLDSPSLLPYLSRWLDAAAADKPRPYIDMLDPADPPLPPDLRSAIRMALNELGVPGPGYPAPVANAVHILTAALASSPAPAGLDVVRLPGESPCHFTHGADGWMVCDVHGWSGPAAQRSRVLVCPDVNSFRAATRPAEDAT